jgi:hypothetical protein
MWQGGDGRSGAAGPERVRQPMKRILVVLAAASLLLLVHPGHAWAFGVKDVITMSRAGIADSLIVEKIDHSGKKFDLDTKDLVALTRAGVSDPVIVAMLRTEDRGKAPHYAAIYPWWPYEYPWYVGLGYGYYAPYYRAYEPFFFGFHDFDGGFGRAGFRDFDGGFGHAGFHGGGRGGHDFDRR